MSEQNQSQEAQEIQQTQADDDVINWNTTTDEATHVKSPDTESATSEEAVNENGSLNEQFRLMSVNTPEGFIIGFSKRDGDPHKLMGALSYSNIQTAFQDLQAVFNHCLASINAAARNEGFVEGRRQLLDELMKSAADRAEAKPKESV